MKIKSLMLPLTLIMLSLTAETQTVSFERHKPCSFTIELPAFMKIKKMFDEINPDYCDYEVVGKDKGILLEIHSLARSRFEFETIDELYSEALTSTKNSITYKMKSSEYFVVSGTKKDGKIYYWKRFVGDNYISDLNIEYTKAQKNKIEPYIGKISKSFKGD